MEWLASPLKKNHQNRQFDSYGSRSGISKELEMVGWKLLAIWLIAISALAVRSLFEFEWRDVALSAIVVLVWPAGERLVHRFGMHGPKWMPFYRSHKRHHEQPTMETGLPDWIVIGLYLLVLWIVAMFGTLDWLTVIASVLVGLASYETVHCLVHSKHRPRTWIGWAIRANHLKTLICEANGENLE